MTPNYQEAKQAVAALPAGAHLLLSLLLTPKEGTQPLLDWYAQTPSGLEEVAAVGAAGRLSELYGGEADFWTQALPDLASGALMPGDAPQVPPAKAPQAPASQIKAPFRCSAQERQALLEQKHALIRSISALYGTLRDQGYSRLRVHAALLDLGVKISANSLGLLLRDTPQFDRAAHFSLVRLTEVRDAMDLLADDAAPPAEASEQGTNPPLVAAPVSAEDAGVVSEPPAVTEVALLPGETAAPPARIRVNYPTSNRERARAVEKMFEDHDLVNAKDVRERLGLPNLGAAITVLSNIKGARHVGGNNYRLDL